jgi:hypothetical protein
MPASMATLVRGSQPSVADCGQPGTLWITRSRSTSANAARALAATPRHAPKSHPPGGAAGAAAPPTARGGGWGGGEGRARDSVGV